MTDGDWHVITVLPHMTAVLLRGALLAEGVRTELDRDALGAVYGLDTGGHATRVLVRSADLARARRVLAELDSS